MELEMTPGITSIMVAGGNTTATLEPMGSEEAWYGISYAERKWQTVGVPTVYTFIVITGLIGNGLVITVLLKYNNMKTIPNIYILNLAIMDFLFLLTLPFQAVQASVDYWPFGPLLCKLVPGCDTINMFASIYTLTFMSADRYIAVVYPISSIRYRTKNKTRIFCSLVWVLAIVLSIPTLIYYDTGVHPSDNKTYCYTKNLPSGNDHHYYFYAYSNFILGFLLPLIVILMAYTTLLYKMLRSNLPLRSDGASAAQRASKRVSVLTISVIVVFFVCWMPYHVVQIGIAMEFSPPTIALRVSNSVVACWCYSNSCFNPLLYTFIGENFKKNLADMCPWCFPKASKFDRGRGRDSSTYTRGGTMRLHNVHNEYTSPTMAPTTTVGSDVYTNDNSPKIQTYTFTT